MRHSRDGSCVALRRRCRTNRIVQAGEGGDHTPPEAEEDPDHEQPVQHLAHPETAGLNGVSRNASGAVTATRPICLYPEVASYKGKGDLNDGANFACRAVGKAK